METALEFAAARQYLEDTSEECLSGWIRSTRTGFVTSSLGLAKDIVVAGGSLTEGPLANWWLDLKEKGLSWERMGHYRLLAEYNPVEDSFDVLVTTASEEKRLDESLRQAAKDRRCLEVLSRSLVQNVTLAPLAMSIVHSLQATLDLSCCLLWVREGTTPNYKLAAAAGANQTYLDIVRTITPQGPPCSAWLVAAQGNRLYLDRLERSSLCLEVEGRLTDGKGGALYVSPCPPSGQSVAILELIGRNDQPKQTLSTGILDTITTLLAMAIERASTFEQMERQASYDPLTGIANHRTMQEFLASRVSECERQGTPLGVVMVDVDHFRRFNEESGHDAGDEVLRQVAQALSKSVRAYDLAARYGGEEFALILPRATVDEALQAAERARKRIASLKPSVGRQVTVSLGVAVYPNSAEEPASLLKAADTALYQAKRNGRNRVCLYGAWLDQPTEKEDLASLVLTTLGDGQKEESMALLERGRSEARVLIGSFGLRSAHLDLLLGALAAWPIWVKDGEGASLRLEVSAGILKGILPLLEAGVESNSSLVGVEGAFVELLRRLDAPRPSSRSVDAA